MNIGEALGVGMQKEVGQPHPKHQIRVVPVREMHQIRVVPVREMHGPRARYKMSRRVAGSRLQ